MEELIKFVITTLVDKKDEVVINVEGDQIMVTVSKDDIGRVIGKQGRVIRALRTVLKAACAKEGKKYFLKVSEPVVAEDNQQEPAKEQEPV